MSRNGLRTTKTRLLLLCEFVLHLNRWDLGAQKGNIIFSTLIDSTFYLF